MQFQMSGGFAYLPGLAAPKIFDVEALDEQTRDTVTALIRDADFFNLSSDTAPSPGAADHYTYRITVEDHGRHHTVSVSDPAPPELQQLIELLRRL